jgi:hypothetical protein
MGGSVVAAMGLDRKINPVQSNGVVFTTTFSQEKVVSYSKCWFALGICGSKISSGGRFEFSLLLG